VSAVLYLSVLCLACTVQSAFGFGLALVALPLLSATTPLTVLVPTLALVSMAIGAGVAWRTREDVQVPLLRALVLSAGLGVPLGVLFLTHVNPHTARLTLGLVVIAASLFSLHANLARVDTRVENGAGRTGRLPAWPFGLAAGALGGAFNAMGPPIVLYLRCSGLAPERFRATLHAFAFLANAAIVVAYGIGRALSEEVATAYALALIPLAAGTWLGTRIAARLDPSRYRTVVDLLLLGLGTALVIEVG